MKTLITCLLVLFTSLGTTRPLLAAPLDEVDDLVELLLEKKDDAESEQVRELAKIQTGKALEGLLKVYDQMGSLYMQRTILQALASFDGKSDLEHTAASKIRDVCTLSSNRQLRKIAIDTLAGCRSVGKAYLASVVRAPADDEVREIALRYHVSRGGDEDLKWYYRLYAGRSRAEEKNGGEKKVKKADRIREAKRREKEAKEAAERGELSEHQKKPFRLEVLREIAFERLLSDFSLSELLKATSDKKNSEIRTLAMAELENRGSEQAYDVAERVYSNARQPAGDRLVAADIIKNAKGEKAIDRFLKDGQRVDQSEEVAMGLADLLASYRSPKVEKASLKILGKGKGQALRFSLRLAAKIENPRVDKVLLKVIKGKDKVAAVDAIRILVARGNEEALEPLGKLVSRSKTPAVIAAALSAVGALNGLTGEWVAELIEYAKHEDLNIRNAAIASMAESKDARFEAAILGALNHENWSTRLVVAEAIRTMQLKAGVGAMALRMSDEVGRSAFEFAQILYSMTGKPFGENARIWAKWWKDEGESFEFISDSDRRKLDRSSQDRAAREISKSTSTFFGIQIKSKFVVFIIDVSGSMDETTRGAYVGEEGQTRMVVAKRELKLAVASLGPDTFFNIIDFSGGVETWMPGLTEASEGNCEKAIDYVDALSAGGGTNLYGAIERSFEDINVDTIYILSDGEPSVGEVIDPFSIQRIVEEWNERRKIKFNCISIGLALDVLENLATNSGGTYLQMP